MLIPRPHEIKKSGSILKNKAIGKVENAFSPLLFRHYKDMILADDSSPTILEIKQDLSVENEEEYHLIIKENRIQIISKTTMQSQQDYVIIISVFNKKCNNNYIKC